VMLLFLSYTAFFAVLRRALNGGGTL